MSAISNVVARKEQKGRMRVRLGRLRNRVAGEILPLGGSGEPPMDDTGYVSMRATKAYIASLGTTGVLLAASLLMLAVVSAVVAFDRWPGGQVSTPLRTLVLSDQPAAIRVSSKSTAPSTRSVVRATGRRAATRTPQAGGGGGVAGERVGGDERTPTADAPSRTAPALVPQVPQQPIEDVSRPIVNAVADPRTTAGQLADRGQSVTDAAGASAGRVDPQVGDAVTQSGQAVADTLRQAPLPDTVIPAH